jgi:tetratricopeptide (TPR) repeat protein
MKTKLNLARRWGGWLLAALAATGVAMAAETPAAPAEVASDAGAPEAIRQFLARAEAADEIADPLQRCLAFPDLPGAQWPAGLARRHCELRYGPRLTLARMRELLDRGALAELDALFAADLERHVAQGEFSEAIHRDFDDMQADYDSGRFTQRWVEAAPKSPYALAMRGAYYQEMGGAARGGKWAKDTPAENMARMREFDVLAIDHYQRALELEPRLMPAWVGLINLSRRDSDEGLERRAIKAARKLDPGCVSVVRTQMFNLQPRWGGSWAQMLALAEELAPMVAERPLVALATVQPAIDVSDVLLRDKDHAKVIEVLKLAVLQSTDAEAHENLAQALQVTDAAATRWQALAHYLTAGRFAEGTAWTNRERGRLLLQAGRAPWAQRYLARAVAQDPDDATGHFLYAASLFHGRRFAESEPEFVAAMKDAQYTRRALNDAARSMAAGDLLDKALGYSTRLVAEYPDHPDSWGVHAYVLGRRGARGHAQIQAVASALEKFMALTEGTTDPRHLREREQARRDLVTLHQALQGAPK